MARVCFLNSPHSFLFLSFHFISFHVNRLARNPQDLWIYTGIGRSDEAPLTSSTPNRWPTWRSAQDPDYMIEKLMECCWDRDILFCVICVFCGPVIEVHLKPLVPCVGFNSRGKVCHNRVRKGLSIGSPMIELFFLIWKVSATEDIWMK